VNIALQTTDGVQLGSVNAGSAGLIVDPEEATAEKIAAAVNRAGFQVSIKQ
jgi:hypothetical protein